MELVNQKRDSNTREDNGFMMLVITAFIIILILGVCLGVVHLFWKENANARVGRGAYKRKKDVAYNVQDVMRQLDISYDKGGKG